MLVLGPPELSTNSLLGLSATDRVLLAPMRVAERLVGLVIIDDRDRACEPLPDEVALLGAVAQFAAMVVERVWLLKAQAEAERLAQLDRVRSEFISSVAHDLQTPITSMRAGLDLLDAAIGPLLAPDEIEVLAVARRNVERLRTRISALLTANQLDAEALHLDAKPLDLRVAALAAVTTVRSLFREKAQALVVDLPQSLPVVGDAHRLEEVIVNVLANGHRHTPSGTRVVMTGRVQAGTVYLDVADNGPGIATEDLDAIFTRFYRGTPSRGGFGLGLAIARSVVELHDGRLWADFPNGRGTYVHLTMPRDPGA